MQLTFLGTGTSVGIPEIGCNCEVCNSLDSRDKRTRTSVFIEVDDLKLVIDTGPDFRQQLLRERITDVDAVLYTHSHKDHMSGLDDIRAINFYNKKSVDVFASDTTIKRLEKEYAYIFEKNYPGLPQINIHLIDKNQIEIKNQKIGIIHAMHGTMPILGFKIKDLVYLTDVSFMEEGEKKGIRNIKTLVINAIGLKKHYSHFNLDEALEFIEDIQPETAYLIHMSHKFGFHKTFEKTLPENVKLSYDGLKLEL